jgi:hypothetical protein
MAHWTKSGILASQGRPVKNMSKIEMKYLKCILAEICEAELPCTDPPSSYAGKMQPVF